MFKDIIFDLDGTLWNPLNTIVKAWNSVLNKYNYTYRINAEKLSSLIGKTNAEIFKILESEVKNFNKKVFEECQQNELSFIQLYGAEIYPNVSETLKTLNENNNLYILSNCQKGYIEAFLNFTHFNIYFKNYDYVGDKYKNKNECLVQFIKKNNLNDFIYVGDTSSDFEACKDLKNCKFIWAKYGYGNIDYPLKINNLKELTNLV